MADGPNVGFATLSVIPTLKGVRKELESQLEDPLKRSAAKAGSQAADELQSAFSTTELIDNPDRLFTGVDAAAGRAGSDAADELSGASSEFRSAGAQLADAASESFDLSPAAAEAAGELSRRLDAERGNVGAAGTALGRAAGDGVEDGLRSTDVSGVGREIGTDAGGGVSSGLLGGLGDLSGGVEGLVGDALAGLPAAAAGPAALAAGAIGAAFVNGFSDAIETEALGDVVAARVGAGATESERFGRVSAGVFRDAWGDSTADVADAVDAVYSTLEDSRASEAALRSLTTRAQAFAEVFEQDVGEAVSNAGVLIETGLADNSIEAFDLMTAAAQRVPAAMRDELGEATQEYSTFFASLGFDGPEAFGILTDAAEEGRYELDKTGDAIKELSIRATDLDDVAASGALERLGIDARDAANALLEGGDAARSATQQILEALSGVEDPAEQASIAIALMGAPLEDLNKSEIPEFVDRLSTASSGMRDAKGASDDLTNSLKGTQTAFTTVKREVLGGFEDYANDVLQPLADYLNSDDPELKDAANSAGEFLGRTIVDGLYLTIGGPLSLFFDLPGKQDLKDALGIGDDPIEVGVEVGFKGGDPGLQLDPSTGQLIPDTETQVDVAVGFKGGDPGLRLDPATGQLVPDQEVDIALRGGNEARLTLEQINTEIELSNELFGLAADRADNYLARISNTSGFDDAITAQLNLRTSSGELFDSLSALGGVDISDFASGVVQVSDEAAAALGNISGAASAAQEQIANALEYGGDSAAIAKAGELRDGFVETFNAAGLTDEQIIDLLASMNLLPEQVSTAIELSGADEALAKLDLLQTRYAEDIPETVQTQIDVAIAEGRFVDAANLLSIWVKDQEDGSISDPLLIAMGLGDTGPASTEVDGWKQGEEGKDPVRLPIGADTGAATEGVEAFRAFVVTSPPSDAPIGANTEPGVRGVDAFRAFVVTSPPADAQVGANTFPGYVSVDQFGISVEGRRFDVVVGADLTPAETAVQSFLGRFPIFSIGAGGADGNIFTPRAAGGPVSSGDLYMVGENEPELFMSDRAGRILNQSQIRDEFSGAGQKVEDRRTYITVPPAPDPERQGARIARSMRRKDYLTGAAA